MTSLSASKGRLQSAPDVPGMLLDDKGQMCRVKLTQRVDEGSMITPSGGQGAAPPDQPVQHSLHSEAPTGAIDFICDTDGP